MLVRSLALAASLLATAGYLEHASRSEETPARAPFAEFPTEVGAWSGREAPDFEPTVLEALGVDEHVNRYYTADNRSTHLYVGYYRSQRQGSTIHSPMNCLPGAGWLPIKARRIDLAAAGADGGREGPKVVNQYVIQKGLDEQVVLYWYQSHGRIVASEYWSKIFLVLDSIRLNRTDAALVRVITPYDESSGDDRQAAEHASIAFANAILPLLSDYLPE
jgi:EpsI family protein